mgnify:CR=1 FL=1
MIVSIDYDGCYTEHKDFFDAMAISMQKQGHQVGVITGEREHERGRLMRALGFTPDFLDLWGEFETIANGAQWKVARLYDRGVGLHFDDDARELKRYTDLWIVKVMNGKSQSKVNTF